MRIRIASFIPVGVAVGTAVAFTFSGCGNSWLDNKDRQKTPSALMFDAQKAYDMENYSLAAQLFSSAVAKDPNNTSARVGWAFALNGEAGLSLLQIVENSIGQTGTGIDSLSNTVGLNAAERTKILEVANATKFYKIAADRLRSAEVSYKLAKLNESWRAICPILPDTVFASIQADDTMKSLFSFTDCRKGSVTVANNSALFAAAIGLFGQAMSLYKLLDPSGTGTPEIVADMKTSVDNITAAKSNLGTALSTLATESGNLNTFMSSDLIPWTLATFETLTNLVASIDGMPTDVKTKILESTSKLGEAKTQMSAYKNTSTTTTTSTTTAATPAQITTAIQNADTIFGTSTTVSDSDKTAVCTNFAAIAASAGIPATNKPCGCYGTTELATATACCNKKSAASSAERTNCCAGLNPTQVAGTACVIDAQVTSLTNLNLAPAPAVNAVPAISLPLEKGSTADSKDATLLGVIEFFQLADKSRR